MVTNRFLTLLKRGKGRIVNTTSYLSRIGAPRNSPYGMSKYALRCYTDCLRFVIYAGNSSEGSASYRCAPPPSALSGLGPIPSQDPHTLARAYQMTGST